jgi:hypothetical protein
VTLAFHGDFYDNLGSGASAVPGPYLDKTRSPLQARTIVERLEIQSLVTTGLEGSGLQTMHFWAKFCGYTRTLQKRPWENAGKFNRLCRR